MVKQNIDDYEQLEKIAIQQGKKALSKSPNLFDRTKTKKGFFFELKENNTVHPNYYAIHCVDGVGTKLFLSAWSDNYSLQPIDAIAMNANDMATAIHSFPDTIDLYLAVQTNVEKKHMNEIMQGFVAAIEKIRIPDAPFNPNIGKIETASLDEIISLGIPGKGWDVGVVMTGYIKKNKVPNLNPKPGNIIVGVSSTGLHSNGYTLARHALFTRDVEYRDEWKNQYKGRFHFNDKPSVLEGKTVIEALQVPTAIYLKEAALIGRKFNSRDIYGINITGNGLANFNRAGQNVSFNITDPLEPLPIHKLLIEESKLRPKQAYTKQNMGMGFAYITPDLKTAESIVNLINENKENKAKIIGEVGKNNNKELRTTIYHPYKGKPLDFIGYNN
ncbi:MAG: AIR synthase-related protein [Candidatus Cloacimonadota bacterium]|nr:AIR synthase-related protein [Candidatus Cloacimonadota bacterium]